MLACVFPYARSAYVDVPCTEAPCFVDAKQMAANGGQVISDGMILYHDGESVYFDVDTSHSLENNYEVQLDAYALGADAVADVRIDGITVVNQTIYQADGYMQYYYRMALSNGIHRIEARRSGGGDLAVSRLGVSYITQAESCRLGGGQWIVPISDASSENNTYVKCAQTGDFVEMEQYTPREGTYAFKLRAMEVHGGTAYAQADIFVDNVYKTSVTVSHATWTWYGTSFEMTKGAHVIRVAFANDDVGRDLYLDTFWLGNYSSPLVVSEVREYDLPGLFEAESLQHVGGIPGKGSWTLLYDGDMVYLQGRSTVSASYEVEVSAYSAGGSKLALELDGAKIGEWNVIGTSTFKQRAQLSIGIHNIAARLSYGGATGDISVDKIRVSYAIQAESCALYGGGWAYVKRDASAENGSIAMLSQTGDRATATLDLPYSASYVVTMRAREDWSGSEHANARLAIDGIEQSDMFVSSTQWKWYALTTGELAAGTHKVSIEFTNDHYNSTARTDRNLKLDVFLVSPLNASTSSSQEVTYVAPCAIYGKALQNVTIQDGEVKLSSRAWVVLDVKDAQPYVVQLLARSDFSTTIKVSLGSSSGNISITGTSYEVYSIRLGAPAGIQYLVLETAGGSAYVNWLKVSPSLEGENFLSKAGQVWNYGDPQASEGFCVKMSESGAGDYLSTPIFIPTSGYYDVCVLAKEDYYIEHSILELSLGDRTRQFRIMSANFEWYYLRIYAEGGSYQTLKFRLLNDHVSASGDSAVYIDIVEIWNERQAVGLSKPLIELTYARAIDCTLATENTDVHHDGLGGITEGAYCLWDNGSLWTWLYVVDNADFKFGFYMKGIQYQGMPLVQFMLDDNVIAEFELSSLWRWYNGSIYIERGPHKFELRYFNDLWGGSPSADRSPIIDCMQFERGCPGYSLTGIVNDESGMPIASAQVRMDGRIATTDENGSYAMRGILAGSYQATVSAAGYLPAYGTIALTGNMAHDFALASSGYILSGNVTSEQTGAMLSGVKLVATMIGGASATVYSDASGRYSVRLMPGNYSISASKDGYATFSTTITMSFASERDIALAPVYRLSGRVLDSTSGLGISGASVSAGGASSVTDASGAYSIALRYGTYVASVLSSGYASISSNVSLYSNVTCDFALDRLPSSAHGDVEVNFSMSKGTVGISYGANERDRWDYFTYDLTDQRHHREVGTQYIRVWTSLDNGGYGWNPPYSSSEYRPKDATPLRWSGSYYYYDWTQLDDYIEAVQNASAEPILSISYAPYFMNYTYKKTGPNYIPNDFNWFGDYCANIVSHYRDLGKKITYWQLWNEPFIWGTWKKVSKGDIYLQMYKSVEPKMHAANASIKLGGPSLAGQDYGFIEDMLRDPGMNFQWCAWHIYATGAFWMNPPEPRDDAYVMGRTQSYEDTAKTVRGWISAYRPGADIKLVIGEYNINSSTTWNGGANVDPRQHTLFAAPWTASALLHMIMGGIDIDLFFLGTGNPLSWGAIAYGFGMWVHATNILVPSFFAKQYFSTYIKRGSTIVNATVVNSEKAPMLEVLAVKMGYSYNIVLVQKENVTRTFSLALNGVSPSSITAHVVDIDSMQGRNYAIAPSNVVTVTMKGLGVTVLEVK